MIFGQDRNELRRMYADAWRKQVDGQVLSPLEAQIARIVGFHPVEGTFTARRRHLDALDRAADALEDARAQQALELMAEELKLAHLALGEIVGETTPDDLLGEIFSSFCIGK